MNKLIIYPLMAGILAGCSQVPVKQVSTYKEIPKAEQSLPKDAKPTIELIDGGLRVCDGDNISRINGYLVFNKGNSDIDNVYRIPKECVDIKLERNMGDIKNGQVTVRDTKGNVADLVWGE